MIFTPEYSYNKTHLNLKKYTLKNLLSPRKIIGNSLEKRKAWK
jgi:hypothetical protein